MIEKVLQRREQIKKAKEMQAINKLAPLFEKIKNAFLRSIQSKDNLRMDETSKSDAKKKSIIGFGGLSGSRKLIP